MPANVPEARHGDAHVEPDHLMPTRIQLANTSPCVVDRDVRVGARPPRHLAAEHRRRHDRQLADRASNLTRRDGSAIDRLLATRFSTGAQDPR
ncbi:MAG: hypothetical protein KGK18_09395, partial [Burkholderiales bacterium]|nr:hypothetical protein [Burkholderiales bacterium]